LKNEWGDIENPVYEGQEQITCHKIFTARLKMVQEAKKQRFSSLSREEIQTLVDNQESENTKKATKKLNELQRHFKKGLHELLTFFVLML